MNTQNGYTIGNVATISSVIFGLGGGGEPCYLHLNDHFLRNSLGRTQTEEAMRNGSKGSWYRI